MCGITGYVSKQVLSPDILEKMVESLIHRGPDSAGYHRSGDFHGGMRRLSINGLSTGNQPLYNHDKSIVMFYNGEIYNYPSLRKDLEKEGIIFRTNSDGEVIVHLFDKMGPKAFELLDGMYGIALWSEKKKTLTLARDIPGEKPLYYARLPDGGLAYSSELPAFKFHPMLDLKLNRQAIWDFPTFLWVPEPETIYENVRMLPRSSYLEFDGKEARIFPIENKFHPYKIDAHDSWSDIVEKTRALVSDTVKSRLLSDVPVGTFLSSGLDSSIVTTIASQELDHLTTFSIGYYPDARDPYEGHADESAEAEIYAKKLGTTHHTIRVSGDDFKNALPLFCSRSGQPYAVSSGLGVMFVARAAHEHGIKTLLSGDGADELFGGYSWYRMLNHPARKTPIKANGIVSMHNMNLSPEDLVSAIASYPAPKQAWAWHYYAAEEEKACLYNAEAFEDCRSSYRIFENYKSDDDWEPIDFVRQDRACYLPYEMMVKLDRMTMAHSVEGRAPLVAPGILNFVEDLSFDQLVRGDVLKPILREAFEDILPESITKRPKHGFRVPIDYWLGGEWADLVEDTFSSTSALSKHGFISKDARQNAHDLLNDTERVNGHTVFCYVMLNMWLEGQK